MIHFNDLSSICKGTVLQASENSLIETLVVDSRKAILNSRSLFFAIQGERHDGHLFLNELYHQGIRQFIVERNIDIKLFPAANILKVSSALDALQAIAAYHRLEFDIPIVAITGSNGKTIIKEWLYQVLSPHLKIVKNPGSYNSQIGVPLSVWQIGAPHQMGIFEAGISKPGEMQRLERIIKPTIGIFTNLGSAHDEGFASEKEKAEEKSKLFTNCETVIYCKDHSVIDGILKIHPSPFTWGFSEGADIHVVQTEAFRFELTFRKEIFSLHLPFQDKASQQNAFHVIAFMLLRGYRPAVIEERIQYLQSIAMRLELKQGINRSLIIDDSYNNDLAGLQISLDFLRNQQKVKKTVILSDVLQSGLGERELVSKIKGMVTSSGVKKVIGIGQVLSSYASDFPGNTFYKTTEEFLLALNPDHFSDEVILVKGARSFGFERIILRLQRKVHGTLMEVNMSSLVHNLNYFKSKLNPGTKVMAMVKAFAYGSGSEEVANLLQYHRVDYLGVAYADEGVELRTNSITLPIMVMNPTQESFDLLLEYKLEPEMYSLRILRAFTDFLDGREAIVHLKIDTGMHRLGFEESMIDEVLTILNENPNVKVGSVFSHLAGADEKEHDAYSHQQAIDFTKTADRIEKSIGYKSLRHLLNSPGILRLPQYQFDMVRLGIGLYGVDPTETRDAGLKPVATLKTIISQIRKIKAGETIGYGRKGKAREDMTLATLAIGYADGFSRSFSQGNGKFLIKGKSAPVVGNVCMDMTMADITGIDAKEGDEVIIFGEDLPITTVAGWINTIPYELLTSTSERVKRVFYAESI